MPEQRYEIEALQARLARALHVAFARSFEKLREQPEQLELSLADLDETIAETEPKDDQAEPNGTAPSKPARHPRPAALPRVIVEHAAPCDAGGGCVERGGTLRKLGEDITELLDYVAGLVPRHPTYPPQAVVPLGRDDHPDSGAQPADPPRTGWRRTARARLGQQKYCDHLPLHRQAETYAREDYRPQPLDDGRQVGQSARLLRPIVVALERHIMAGGRVHADDTVVPMLEPGLGRTRTARLWVYVRDDRPFAGPDPAAVFYRYTPDRKGEHPRAHLSEFRGILQTDGYAGFAKLYGGNRIVEATCFAHSRRIFWDVHEAA